MHIYGHLICVCVWLCQVIVAERRLSLVAASGGCSSLWCTGFSLRCLLLFQNTGSRGTGFSSCSTPAQQLQHAGPRACRLQQLLCVGSVVVVHGLQGAWASVVVAHGLSSCGSQALVCSLSSCGAQAQLLHGMWDLPGPGSNLCPLWILNHCTTREVPTN